MSQKRTKQQKMRAQYHYAVPTRNSFSGSLASSSETLPKNSVESLYFYDPAFITRDIKRTAIISTLLLLLLAGLQIFWK